MLKNNRILTVCSSMVIILTLMFGLTGNAFAETTDTPDEKGISVGITNILRAKNNIEVPNVTFEYTYTKDGLVSFQKTGSDPIGRDLLEDNTQPNLLNTVSQLKAEYKTHMNAYPNMIDNRKIYKIVGNNIIPNADAFKHAGVYSYTIREEISSEGECNKYIDCSQAEYKLFVYVENTDDGLAVAAATVYKIKDDDGQIIDKPGKVDLDKNTYAPNDGNDFIFINDYNPDNVGFTIVNSVSGRFADYTKSFDFELTMLNPEGETNEHTYKAVLIDEETNHPVSDNLLSFTTDTVTAFQMKDKQRLTFVTDEYVLDKEKELTAEETEFLPAGTSFLLVNKTAPSYICKYTPTIGGEATTTMIGNVGKDVNISDMYLNLGLNQISINQAYKTIAVTGVIAKVLPALILMLLAVAGIMSGCSLRRRNAVR